MSRTPLVLVHGNPESAAVWGPLIGELGRADAVVLSPPGFGVPAPQDFDRSPAGYRDWLASQLELFRDPVDLVGHDWGGIHVAALATSRPDLIRSWASDALGVYAPDYTWHPRAQVWQQEGPGEESVRQLWGGDLQQRLAVASALGMTGRMAERVAAGMDPEMGRAVLALLRAARQPTMAEAGKLLPDAARRPGLALIALDDVDQASGTVEQHEWAAHEAGARIARPPRGRRALVAGGDPGPGRGGPHDLLGRARPVTSAREGPDPDIRHTSGPWWTRASARSSRTSSRSCTPGTGAARSTRS